jgi:serine O-acetyltransferase
VPPNSVVVGVPGQIVHRSQPHLATDAPDLNHTRLPDLVGATLTSLLTRVETLEKHLNGHLFAEPTIHAPQGGEWRGEDFSI